MLINVLLNDGSHIPVMPHRMNHSDYSNDKGLYLVLVQAVLYHKYFCIGW